MYRPFIAWIGKGHNLFDVSPIRRLGYESFSHSAEDEDDAFPYFDCASIPRRLTSGVMILARSKAAAEVKRKEFAGKGRPANRAHAQMRTDPQIEHTHI